MTELIIKFSYGKAHTGDAFSSPTTVFALCRQGGGWWSMTAVLIVPLKLPQSWRESRVRQPTRALQSIYGGVGSLSFGTRADIIVSTDADNQYSAEDIPKLS